MGTPLSTDGSSPAADDDKQSDPPGETGNFWRFAASGVFFQGGVASVEANTIVSALVQGLTGSSLAVGIAAAITRYGWLFPQIIVAYLARRRDRRMPYYKFGAFGRAACLAAIAMLLWFGANLPGDHHHSGVFRPLDPLWVRQRYCRRSLQRYRRPVRTVVVPQPAIGSTIFRRRHPGAHRCRRCA